MSSSSKDKPADMTRRQITVDERDLLVDHNRQQALEALGLGTDVKDINDADWDKAAECIKRASDLAKDTRQASLRTVTPAADSKAGKK